MLWSLLLISVALVGCTRKSQETKMDVIQRFQETISYPYVATATRTSQIMTHLEQLKKGMRIHDVIQKMGAPDEVNPTWDARKNGQRTGRSLVYVVKRRVASGSVNERAERLVRIHFDLSDQLVSAHAIDMADFKTIE